MSHPAAAQDWWRDFFRGTGLDIWRAWSEPGAAADAQAIARLLALRPGARLLDVPCGEGRLAREMAARGLCVTGVDLSPECLDGARSGPAGDRVEWIRLDMRELPWSTTFDGAICAGSSFGYFDHAGNERFLGAVARALRARAPFVLETSMVRELVLPGLEPARTFRLGSSTLVEEWRRLPGDRTVEVTYTIEQDGASRRSVARYTLYSLREIRDLLAASGFEDVEEYGSIELEPFGPGSSRLFLRSFRSARAPRLALATRTAPDERARSAFLAATDLIVYGDSSQRTSAGALLDGLAARLDRAGPGPRRPEVLLALAGQIEQAVEDAASGPAAGAARRLTDLAARSWIAAVQERSRGAAIDAADPMRDVIATWPGRRDLPVTIRTPEGFAQYALDPGGFAAAARIWSARHGPPSADSVAVIGIRSIGTSLSALVAAVLCEEGWDAHRLTVRPEGHPFERRLDLDPMDLAGARLAVVVDEGPGLSGSSMASVARALERSGLPPASVTFLPAHDRGPGPRASTSVRECWSEVPRIVAAPALAAGVAADLEDLIGPGETITGIEEIGSGTWPRRLLPDPRDWPPALRRFRRPALAAVASSGRAWLLAYEGIASCGEWPRTGADTALERISRAAAQGWCTPALGSIRGFVVQPWDAGESMAGRSPSAGDLDQLARFLVGTPSGVLEASEVRAARERLGRMLVWNAQRLLGPDAREPAGRAVDAALSVDADPQPAWSDPSLGSAEWVRTDEGRLRKLQPGAGPDHTMAGRQEVAWALAGCELEWALDLPGRDRLISAFARHGGSPPTREVLHMHRLAAAALQAGMCRLCLDDETEPAERSRIEATGAARVSWLSALLGLS